MSLKQTRKIEIRYFVQLRVKQKYPIQHLDKLVGVPERPYQITGVDCHAVVIENQIAPSRKFHARELC